jgi:hypothetical protein
MRLTLAPPAQHRPMPRLGVGMYANKMTTAYHLIGTTVRARVCSSVHRTNWAF